MSGLQVNLGGANAFPLTVKIEIMCNIIFMPLLLIMDGNKWKRNPEQRKRSRRKNSQDRKNRIVAIVTILLK